MNHGENFCLLEEKVLAKGERLKLVRLKYREGISHIRECEAVCRLGPERIKTDCVSVVGVLRRSLHYDCLLLVKQFRPAVDTFTIEFPTGLINGDGSEKAGIRTLKAVTGYTGKVRQVGGVTALDPSISSSTMRLVVVEVNGDEVINTVPSPSANEGHLVELLHVPVIEINERLQEYAKEGFIIDSRVQSYALALLLCGVRQPGENSLK